MVRFVVMTISDSGAAGSRKDASGALVETLLTGAGWSLTERILIPDEREIIADRLVSFCTTGHVDVVVTTGGTGLGPRDVTPEATKDVIEREIPGMAEAMRMEGLRKTPFSMISRQVVGVRGTTLIVNLPGSPKAVEEGLQVIMPVIPHVIQLLQGHTRHDAQ